MRKIEEQMLEAISSFNNKIVKNPEYNNRPYTEIERLHDKRHFDWSSGNTSVRAKAMGMNIYIEVLLYHNIIAKISWEENENGKGWIIKLTNCGWPTRTTHSRLNAILEHIGLSDRFTSKNSKDRTFSLGFRPNTLGWQKIS